MIQKNTLLSVVDKCGVWVVNTFHLYKGGLRTISRSGEFIKVSVRKTRPTHWFLKKSKFRAIIILTKKERIRLDGSLINFSLNSCLLLKKRLTPRGKELIGPIGFGNRRKKFTKSFSGII